MELGIGVFKPMAPGRYDLIFEVGEQLQRVQCKWAPRHGDVIIVRCYSNRRSAEGSVRRIYDRSEIDAFAAYCADLRRCYFLPFDLVPRRGTLQLRLSGTLNNQDLGIHWASQYELAATLADSTGP
jgi:hypothetical protein